ncbi:alpha/beta fold hydrolase [Rhizobium sp. P40RR-XXII]|uniref:alpha/beta fold hydrolase n=1 Tax=Rhizobium sp. P40RR-XXII TaxID=2726739 RepID=UPI0014564307|nr:alpha/beta fold hydrolase [Rhizobium sp. P40RR-XXII]NLS18555.1 alpha/beta fold hydrolase [Rhizobium sp. P40RR-XXII]
MTINSAASATLNPDEPAALSFFTTGDGVQIAYRIDGRDDRPALILANSIATTMHMWDLQIPKFAEHFRVIRYDYRGHGGSDVPAGAYSDGRLGRDVLELMGWLGIKRAHFLGLSLGGWVGQWLAIHSPERIERLVLSNTSSYLGPAETFDKSIAATLAAPDMKEAAETFLGNWFPSAMIAANGPVVRQFREMLLNTPRQGLAGLFAAVRDADMRRTAALIQSPTLVIAGEFDTVTSLSMGEAIASTIPGARLKTFPAVHFSNIEYSQVFSEEVVAFLNQTSA